MWLDVLIIRPGGIGDLIMLSSAVWAMRQQNPGLRVSLATKDQFVELFSLPVYHEVMPMEEAAKKIGLGQRTYYKIYDLTGAVESPKVGGRLKHEIYMTENRIDIFERLLGVFPPSPIKRPMICSHFSYEHNDDMLLGSEIERIKDKIDYGSKRKWIVVQISCATPIRTISPDYLKILAGMFDDDIGLVWFGGEKWLENHLHYFEGNGVNLINKTSLKEMISLCHLADGIIAPDSGAVHVAAAMGKKCIAVFGNIDPYLRTAYYPTVRALYANDKTVCGQFPCGDSSDSECYMRAMLGGRCLRLITPEMIYKEAVHWFGLERKEVFVTQVDADAYRNC
jgi:ADP-heptose:LPS heptosyltransferase